MGSTVYDWSPVTQALGGLAQQYQYKKMLGTMFGQGPQAGPAPAQQPQELDAEGNVLAPPPGSQPSHPMSGGFSGANPAMLPLLQMLGPQASAPLLLQMMMKQNEYDPTVQYDQNGRAFRVNKTDNTPHYIDGVTRAPNIEFVNGQAVNKNTVAAGTIIPPQKEENPLINNESGQMSSDHGKTWVPIPNFTSRAATIANAKRADKPPNPNAPISLVHPSGGY